MNLEALQGADQPRERPGFSGIIRPIQINDIDFVREILSAWVSDSQANVPLSGLIEKYLEKMRASINGENTESYFVAQEEDQVIGVVGMSDSPKRSLLKFTTTERPVELMRLYVDPKHRKGRGVGSGLVDRVRHEARSKGFTEIILDSGDRYSESGWPFHDRQFPRRGIARHQYGVGFHAVVWGEIL